MRTEPSARPGGRGGSTDPSPRAKSSGEEGGTVAVSGQSSPMEVRSRRRRKRLLARDMRHHPSGGQSEGEAEGRKWEAKRVS